MVYQQEDWGKEVLHDSSGLEVVEHHKSKGYFIDLPPPPSEPKILGLRRITFVLAVALVVAITGAAVAGGVGASMVSQCSRRTNTISPQQNNSSLPNSDASQATTTITQTVTGTSLPTSSITSNQAPTPSTLSLACPSLDDAGQQTISIFSRSWHFTPICGTDYSGFDIVGVISYSFHDCMQACAMYNYYYGSDQCVVVHFTTDMVGALAANGANCWLKNGTAADPDRGEGNTVVSGLLAGSE